MANRFMKGAFILSASGFVVKIIGSLNWIFLSRVMGGEGIGIYQMAFPIYLLALQVSSAGIPIAISIVTAEKLAKSDIRGAKHVFNVSFVLLFITGLICSVLMYTTAQYLIDIHYIVDPRAYYALIALSPAIFFVTLISCFRGYLQGWQDMVPTAYSQVIEQILRVVIMLVAAYLLLPYGLAAAAGGASLGAGVGALGALLLLVYYFYKQQRAASEMEDALVPQQGTKSIIAELIKLAIPISLASIMLPLVANLDLFIVPKRLLAAGYTVNEATELFGYLTGMAVPLINLCTLFTAAGAMSIVPTISEARASNDPKRVYKEAGNAIRFTYIVTVPFAVVLFVLADPIVTLIYNAPKAALATQILSCAVFFLGFHQITTGMLQGLGKPIIPVINMGIAAFIKVLLNYNLTAIPTLGIAGASWATVADIGVAALLNLYIIYRKTGYFLDLSLLWKNIVSAAIMGVVVYGINLGFGHLGIHSGIVRFLALFVTVAIGFIVYGIMMILVKAMNKEDAARIPYVGRFLG